jgi:hypothetical protein
MPADASGKGDTAKASGDQSATDVATFKATAITLKAKVEKTHTDSEDAKTKIDDLESHAQTTDTEAENQRVARVAAGDAAAGTVDPDLSPRPDIGRAAT